MMLFGRLFRPGQRAIISVLVMVPLLMGLGLWQCHRLVWKRDLLNHLAYQMAQPPINAPTNAAQADDLSFRPMVASGVFDPDLVVAIPARMHKGVLGGKILHLLRRAEGPAIWIDRGWVPQSVLDDLKNPKNKPPFGVRSISGLARLPEHGNIFTPDHDPRRGWWYRPDPVAMANHFGAGAVMPFWIEQTVMDNPETTTSAGPVLLPALGPDLPNNHLSYALTWFGLAAVLVVIFVIHGLKNDAEQGAASERPHANSPDSGGL